MPLSKIKSQYATAIVAFGNSGLPLGKRTDIDDLAILAQKSGNKNLLQMFEVLPDLDTLLKAKTDKSLEPILEKFENSVVINNDKEADHNTGESNSAAKENEETK